MKLIVIIWRLYKDNGYICGHDKTKNKYYDKYQNKKRQQWKLQRVL